MADGSRLKKVKGEVLGTSAFSVTADFCAGRKCFTSSLLFLIFPFLLTYPLIKALVSEGSAIQEFQFYTAAKSRGFRKGF